MTGMFVIEHTVTTFWILTHHFVTWIAEPGVRGTVTLGEIVGVLLAASSMVSVA